MNEKIEGKVVSNVGKEGSRELAPAEIVENINKICG